MASGVSRWVPLSAGPDGTAQRRGGRGVLGVLQGDLRTADGRPGVGAPGSAAVSRTRALSASVLWVLLELICVAVFFEAEIRGIGGETVGPGTRIFGSFWLSDVGLLLPCVLAVARGRLRHFAGARLMVIVSGCLVYATAIFLLNGWPSEQLGGELRIYGAFICGICSILVLKDRIKTVVSFVSVVTLSCVLLAGMAMFAFHGDILEETTRATTPMSFILLGVPMALIAPAILLSEWSGSSVWRATSWAALWLVLAEAIFVLQTRSLFLGGMAAAILAVISAVAVDRYSARGRWWVRVASLGGVVAIACVTFVGLTRTKEGIYLAFSARMESAIYNFYHDPGIRPRFDEVEAVVESMDDVARLFGEGLNPPKILVDNRGEGYNVMHVGVLNVWWRFGGIIFGTLVIGVAVQLGKWLRLLVARPKGDERDAESVALLVCVPGGITLLVVSVTSGGWGVSNMLGLGMVMGMYWVLSGQTSESDGRAARARLGRRDLWRPGRGRVG